MKKRSIKKQLIAQFYRGNILAFSISIFAALATGSLNLILSWFTQQLVDAASGAENALPLYALLKLIVGFIILCVGIKLLDYIAHPLYLKRAIQQYKDYAFNILVGKSISSFRDESTAAYVSALTNDTTSIEVNYLGMQLSMITMLVTFLGALIMMFCTSPLLTVISIGVTILPLIASLLTGGKLEAAEVRVSDCNRNFTAALHDCLSGFSVVKSFKAEKEIYELFKKNNQALEKQKFSRERIKVMVGMIGAVTGIFAQLSVFLAGAYLAAAGKGLTAGTVILFVNLMNFTIQPVAVLPGLLANRKAALGLVRKLADALEKNPTACGSQTISEISQGIELKNVCFGYEEGKEVLHNICLLLTCKNTDSQGCVSIYFTLYYLGACWYFLNCQNKKSLSTNLSKIERNEVKQYGNEICRTLYLGSLKSDVYFCIYEKDYEQCVKLGTPLEEADIINRFEIP